MARLNIFVLTLSGEIGHKNVRFDHSLWFVETEKVARLDIFMSNLNTGFRCYFCYHALPRFVEHCSKSKLSLMGILKILSSLLWNIFSLFSTFLIGNQFYVTFYVKFSGGISTDLIISTSKNESTGDQTLSSIQQTELKYLWMNLCSI